MSDTDDEPVGKRTNYASLNLIASDQEKSKADDDSSHDQPLSRPKEAGSKCKVAGKAKSYVAEINSASESDVPCESGKRTNYASLNLL